MSPPYVECCGREQTTPFCGHCGNRLESGLCLLVRHCRSVVVQKKTLAEKWAHTAEEYKAKNKSQDWVETALRRVQMAKENGTKWQSWADELAALLVVEEDATGESSPS